MNWYQIWTNCDSPLEAEVEWQAAILKRLNRECGHYEKCAYYASIPVRQSEKAVSRFSFISRVGSYIIPNELRSAIGNRAPLLQFGEVTPHSLNCSTMWSRHRVTLRGGKNAYCWICDSCGQLQYFPMGDHYVLAGDLQGHDLFMNDSYGFIVAETVLPMFQTRKWPRMKISKLTVLNVPRDGFPLDLMTTPKEIQRRWAPSQK